jgi:hypothetical protein
MVGKIKRSFQFSFLYKWKSIFFHSILLIFLNDQLLEQSNYFNDLEVYHFKGMVLGWFIWILFSTFLGGSFKNKFIILHWLHILNFKLFGLDLAVRWVFKFSPSEILSHFQQLVTTSWHHFRKYKSIANFISFNLSYNTFNSMQ